MYFGDVRRVNEPETITVTVKVMLNTIRYNCIVWMLINVMSETAILVIKISTLITLSIQRY